MRSRDGRPRPAVRPDPLPDGHRASTGSSWEATWAGPHAPGVAASLLALSRPVRFIHGDGERDVLGVDRGEEPARVPKGFRDAVRWPAGSLTPELLSGIRA